MVSPEIASGASVLVDGSMVSKRDGSTSLQLLAGGGVWVGSVVVVGVVVGALVAVCVGVGAEGVGLGVEAGYGVYVGSGG
jgi:hypothetical protein